MTGITAAASLATAVALVTPKILQQVEAAALSEERGRSLQAANVELERAAAELQELDQLKTGIVAQRAANLGTWEWRPGENRLVGDRRSHARAGAPVRSTATSEAGWRPSF